MRKHSDLRLLALAYYWGWIPRDKYLDLRQRYLNAITERKQPKPINRKELAPPKKDSDITGPSSNPLMKRKTVIITAIIIIVAVALVIVLSPQDREKIPADQQQAQDLPNADLKKQADSPEVLFTEFMNSSFIRNTNWDQGALNILKFKWQSLSEQQQATVRDSKIFESFSEILVAKISEERGQGNVVPSDEELILITTARNLGLLELVPNEGEEKAE